MTPVNVTWRSQKLSTLRPVAESNWSSETLIARVDAAMLLYLRGSVSNAELPALREEFRTIVEAVDEGRMTNVEARLRFEGLIADARSFER
ncbi:hypothetical protein DVJ78_18460 (plasmid) [Humibacter sp. BT305]|nr:hypothetical protein DVJ78_18460 [Humibacter sp. BT305]